MTGSCRLITFTVGGRQRYGSIEIGNRGGIITSKTRLHAPLD